MKYIYRGTKQIVDIPDGTPVNQSEFTPVGGGEQPQAQTQTEQSPDFKTQYQQIFNKTGSLKNRNAIASAYKTATGQELFGTTEASAEEKKAAIKKTDLENVFNLLEDKYTTKKLAKGRIGGLLATILGATGFNPDVTDYQTLRESIKPQLSKGAGDVGNLAIQEQQAAIGQIPTVYSTPEEAALQFATARKKFNLPESKKSKRKSLEDIFK